MAKSHGKVGSVIVDGHMLAFEVGAIIGEVPNTQINLSCTFTFHLALLHSDIA